MASSTVIAATVMILLLALYCVPLPQAQPIDGAALLIKCQPPLLLLLPCIPYAQGFLPSPSDECCDNLRDVEGTNPECLCLLVDGHSPVPVINLTDALQLPRLCHVSVDMSRCRTNDDEEEDTPPPSSPDASPSPPQPTAPGNGQNRTATSPGLSGAGGLLIGERSGSKRRVEGLSLLVLASIPLLATVVST